MKLNNESSTQKAVPLISVVICTYNRAEMLKDCVLSLLEQDFPKENFEVLVIDDGSTDDTVESIKELHRTAQNADAIRYYGEEHRGVNATRNAGLRKARGEIVVFSDDDTLAPPDYLQRIWTILKNDSTLTGVGGPLRDTGRSMLKTCPECSLAGAYFDSKEKVILPELIGGNMAIRTKMFLETGTFDEEISGRGDETEWFRRAEGGKFLYDPELWVWHRRDNFSLIEVCRLAFRQGRAIPVYSRKIGTKHRIKPLKILRFFGHALVSKCTRGATLGFREIGAAVASFSSFQNKKQVHSNH